MKTAIFGGRGYLGSQLGHFFRQKGDQVDSFDLPEADVTSDVFWEGFNPSLYDSILFFAGLTGTERSFTDADRFVAVNEFGLLGLLKRVAPLGSSAPFVVFPSTRLVYKGAEHPLREDDEKEAKTVYAATKLACEALLQAYATRFGLRHAVIRICVPYGNIVSHDYSYGTVGFFMKQAAAGNITLYGDGSLRRTFTHVADICEVVGRLAEKGACGTFNIGGSDLALTEAAGLIAEKMAAKVSYLQWPDVAMMLESGSTCLNATRLATAIGFGTYRSFAKSINEI